MTTLDFPDRHPNRLPAQFGVNVAYPERDREVNFPIEAAISGGFAFIQADMQSKPYKYMAIKPFIC